MNNPPIFNFPASPGTPLFPVSPDRTNQQRHMQPFPIAFPSLKKINPPPEIPLLPTAGTDLELDFDFDAADAGDENQILCEDTILEEGPDASEGLLAPGSHEMPEGLGTVQLNENATSSSQSSKLSPSQGIGQLNPEKGGTSPNPDMKLSGWDNQPQGNDKNVERNNRRKSHRGTPRRQQQRAPKKPTRASTSLFEGQMTSEDAEEQLRNARDKWAQFATKCPEWESGRVERAPEPEPVPHISAVMAKYRSSSSGSEGQQKAAPSSSPNSEKQNTKPEAPVKSTRFAETSPKQLNDKSSQGSNRPRDRKRNDHALRRAELGREEAESEVKRLRMELERLNDKIVNEKQSSESDKARSDMLTKEVEKLKLDLTTANTRLARAEKHHKRAVKDAMKTSSAIVGLQGELKTAREDLNSTKSSFEMERVKSKKREEEAFQAQFKLIGVEEELARAKQQIKLLEGERDALKTNLKEEEVARIAAQGQIALPVSRDDAEFGSPKAERKPAIKPNALIEEEVEELDMIKDQLDREKMRADEAEELVQFMQRECQLGICACQLAKQKNSEYIYDKQLHEHVKRRRANEASTPNAPQVPEASVAPNPSHIEPEIKSEAVVPLATEERPQQKQQEQLSRPTLAAEARATPEPPQSADAEEPAVMFSPSSGTFHANPTQQAETADTIVPEEQHMRSRHTQEREPHRSMLASSMSAVTPSFSSSAGPFLQTPARRIATPAYPHTHAATRTIPLAPPADFIDHHDALGLQKMSREEALEQIRQRRGRARSIAAGTFTPRKQMVNPAPKRDFSAPIVRPN
ncbi:hypothetical protein L228DRAFT_281168 [Xylona heveae TC161]|uniref:Uncharacterized protein n=1 Tax=Xylona heveae (strain CBS 132557 / TC161) TaxID=1328760 RepID=A0A161TPE6_XYLHT|nr:hypothetical protein L228DRAFT_281168 [Xylona heveae TC161]KZF24056.1 hypothetical protein L228DRAFT_281168 [Xylona heveae TC161]